MNYSEVMRGFYDGRKAKALVEALVSALLVLMGGLALTRSNHLVHQFGLTVLVSVGIFMLPMRVRDYLSADPRLKGTKATLLRSQTEFLQAERAYLDEVIANLRRNYLIDAIAVVLGLVAIAVGISLQKQRLIGRGLGLLLCAITRFAGEAWERRDVVRYTAALETVPAEKNPLLSARV